MSICVELSLVVAWCVLLCCDVLCCIVLYCVVLCCVVWSYVLRSVDVYKTAIMLDHLRERELGV